MPEASLDVALAQAAKVAEAPALAPTVDELFRGFDSHSVQVALTASVRPDGPVGEAQV